MSQLFKTIPPKLLLYDFLNTGACKEKNYYIFSKDAFKSLVMKNEIEAFLEKLRPHYYSSKLYYLDRKPTFKTFATILRQICKIHKIPIESIIKYNNSSYYISYKISIV